MSRPQLLPIPPKLSIIVHPEGAPPVIEGLYLDRLVQRLSRTTVLSHLRWDRVHVHLFTEEATGRAFGWALDRADGDGDGVILPGEKRVAVASRPNTNPMSVFGTLIHEFGHLISDGHGKSHVDACLTIAYQAGILTDEQYEHGLDTLTGSQACDNYISKAAKAIGILDLLAKGTPQT